MIVTGAVAFAVAVLAGMGLGGAGLFTAWAAFFCGAPQLTAQGVNLLFSLFSTAGALTVNVAKTRILWGCFAILAPFGVLGSLAGAALAQRLSPALLQKLCGALLAWGGAATLRRALREKAPARGPAVRPARKI